MVVPVTTNPPRGPKRSAGTSGSSSSSSDKKKKKTPADSIAKIVKLTDESVGSNKGHILNTPHPMYRPYLYPGGPKQPYVGNVSPDKVSQPHNNYRFIFHWNPAEIDIDASTSYNASVAPKSPYTDGARNLFVTTTTMSFQIMIERQEEVATKKPLGRPTKLQYGSNLYGGIAAHTFDQVGTLYDLEILYTVINGPQKQSGTTPASAPAISAAYILSWPMYVTFGTASQFYGNFTDLSINHIMFNERMVPIVTYVQLSLSAIALKDPYRDLRPSAERLKAPGTATKHSGTTP